MNKQIPAINKIVEFQNFKRSMQLHETKVKNAKPTLTTRVPNPLKINITLNKTAKQPFGNSFSRMIDIEFENKALLKKLTEKTSKPATSPQNHLQSWQQQSYMKQITNNRKRYFEQHQRRIQNQGLLKRIKSIKPLYQMRKYMSQRKTTELYINSISKFNYKNYKPNKTIIKFDMDVVRNDVSMDSSRKKQLKEEENQHQDKQNIHGRIATSESFGKNHQTSHIKKVPTIRLKKANMVFTERNPNTTFKIHQNTTSKINPNTKPKPMEKAFKLAQPLDMKESASSFYKASQKSFELSQSQTKMMQSSFVVSQIPEKEIRLNGKVYILKGKETMTKVRLQILQVKRDKSIGNEYIHEVEISSGVFKKKFGGRVDQIVENLKFSEKNQAFYIG